MRISCVTPFAFLLATVVCRVVPSSPRQYTAKNITTLIKLSGTSRSVTSDLGDLRPALGADSPPPAKRPKLGPDPPAAAPQSEWDKYVCRGEKLTQASKLDKHEAEAIAIPIGTQWSGNLQTERKLWGYFDSPDPDCDFEGSYYDITKALEALNVEDGECFRTYHYDPDKDGEIKDQTYKVGGKDYHATGAYATFGINVEAGAIFFIDVASAPRRAAQLWGVDPVPKDQLPALRQISDIAWGFWHQAHSGSDLGHIEKIIVTQVINDITGRLIDEALQKYEVPDGEQRHETVPEWPGITFDIETPAGKSLLGSPVGIAAGYFLSQHKPEIGKNKYVSKVTVFVPDEDTGQDEPTIIYYIEDAPTPLQEDADAHQTPAEVAGPSKTQRRSNDLNGRALVSATNSSALELPTAFGDIVSAAGKKLDDVTLWRTCKCRGEKITQASLENKDMAMKLVTPIDSPWEGGMEAELKLWGYKEPKGFSIYCHFDNVAAPLKDMGVDTKFKEETKDGQNECYQTHHSRGGPIGKIGEQTYVVKDKTYRMTNAIMQIGVNARDGMITFFNVRSAMQAAKITWRVEEPDVADLPELKQVSDISWGFWNRAHKDGTGLSNIQKFHVHDAVNEDTLRLVKMALKTYQVPKGDTRRTVLPKWPGLVFSIETDEGKVMLGSPNGLAAGYFLVQHKTQLGGNKYIYQVTLWNDLDGDVQMVFWVKDAPPPTTPEEQETARGRL